MDKEEFIDDEQGGLDDINNEPEVFATATTNHKKNVSRRDFLKIATTTAIASVTTSCDVDPEVLVQPTVAKLPPDLPAPTSTKIPANTPNPTWTARPTSTAKPTADKSPHRRSGWPTDCRGRYINCSSLCWPEH